MMPANKGGPLMLKALKLASVLVALSTPALAEVNGTVRIGVLNDMSSVYADFQGPGSVLAARMAVEGAFTLPPVDPIMRARLEPMQQVRDEMFRSAVAV